MDLSKLREPFDPAKRFHRWSGATASERFWSKVRRSEGCWEWMASKDRKGYGKFGRSDRRGWMFAHRFAYLDAVGPIPTDAIVRHSCDNPACVRPDHLLIGSQADNQNDMDLRNRRAVGQAVSRTKRISEEDVQLIRRRAQTELQYRLAKEYGVSKMTISRIARRELWRHVP